MASFKAITVTIICLQLQGLAYLLSVPMSILETQYGQQE